MKKLILILSTLVFSQLALAQNTIVISSFNHKESVNKILSTIKAKGLTHFSTIHHHLGAKKVNSFLRPTTLIIFGNPKVGTQLMKENQLMGIELPLKVLVFETETGDVKVAYHNPSGFSSEYSLNKKKSLLVKIDKAMNSIISVIQK